VLPALRTHTDDIPALVAYYIGVFNREFKKNVRGASVEAMRVFDRYHWPGNVRELRNAIERALILSDGGLVTSEHLPIPAAGVPASPAPSSGTIESTEREMIAQALARTDNNKSKAARILGLTRAQLRSRLEKYGLDAAD